MPKRAHVEFPQLPTYLLVQQCNCSLLFNFFFNLDGISFCWPRSKVTCVVFLNQEMFIKNDIPQIFGFSSKAILEGNKERCE